MQLNFTVVQVAAIAIYGPLGNALRIIQENSVTLPSLQGLRGARVCLSHPSYRR